jgi:hypothetical protein
VKEQTKQIAGYGQDDIPAPQSFTTQGVMKGSKLDALEVTSVTAGGAMDTYYGLRPNDEITAVNGMTIDVIANNDEELAKSQVVQEGFQKKAPLNIRRGGQPMTLPLPAGSPAARRLPQPPAQPGPAQPGPAEAPSAAAPAPAQPAAPAPAAPPARPKKNTIQDQLQGIRDAAGDKSNNGQ